MSVNAATVARPTAGLASVPVAPRASARRPVACATARGGAASTSSGWSASSSSRNLAQRRSGAAGRDGAAVLAVRARSPIAIARRRRFVQTNASLFGVGAPEALVIGVVALLVFGPKGLADIAKQLGQTLRAFQPTIRELQEVSREFKETLEDEIGLDEIRNDIAQVAAPVPTKRQAPPPGTTTTPEASATGPTDQSTDTVTEEMRAAAAAAAWGGDEPVAVAGPDDVATDADAKETAANGDVPGELAAPEGTGAAPTAGEESVQA